MTTYLCLLTQTAFNATHLYITKSSQKTNDYMAYVDAWVAGIGTDIYLFLVSVRSSRQPQSIKAHGRAVGEGCGVFFASISFPRHQSQTHSQKKGRPIMSGLTRRRGQRSHASLPKRSVWLSGASCVVMRAASSRPPDMLGQVAPPSTRSISESLAVMAAQWLPR